MNQKERLNELALFAGGGEDCLPPNLPTTELSVTSNGTNTVSKSSRRASGTDTLTMLQFGMIATPSTGIPGLDTWISSLPVFLANLLVKPERDLPSVISAMDGQQLSALLTRYDLQSSSWKMFQGSFPSFISEEYLGTWPSSGSMRNGVVYRRPPLARRTCGTDFGLLPTPRASRSSYNNSHGKRTWNLPGMAFHNKWPTPTVADSKDQKRSLKSIAAKSGPTLLQAVQFATPGIRGLDNGSNGRKAKKSERVTHNGGKLNPDWVEWLMGWPIGWTDLQPLGMDRFQQWLRQHSISY